jgi:prefoldin alpha subunit
VPLTQSLYVPGQLASTSTVIVDVGTGFYVEKSTSDAVKFYSGKVDELSKNLSDLEKVVQGKNENLRIVEEGESIQPTALSTDIYNFWVVGLIRMPLQCSARK